MNDGVAVRANRSQISDRIQAILLPYSCDRYDMMDLDVPRSWFSVSRSEVETTDSTGPAVVLDTFLAGSPVSLVRVHKD
jgi:hypothetical protein